jgi:hypothetical protein
MTIRALVFAFWLLFCGFDACLAWGQTNPPPPACQVEPISFDGWHAMRMANQWVSLTLVPQLGGRLMQVAFGGHAYLFVNPAYQGKEIPPSEGEPLGRWFNYGGDKIWPMPEGRMDEQHWAGPLSGPLDDGVYRLHEISKGARCAVRLDGPPDPRTGLQYTREISIGRRSPEISFHAVMKNAAGYPIRWSVQSVTQYDLSDAQQPSQYNHNFWAFTPANPHSAYLNQYHVRDGLAESRSFAVKGGIFTLHWLYFESEVWVDSPGGWLAAVDGATHYAMVERFHYDALAKYPGKATVIFYQNGPSPDFDAQGMPQFLHVNHQETPYYMEAEINSPMVTLAPGATYAFDTQWFPTRMEGTLSSVRYAGAIGKPFHATAVPGGVKLSGAFGVFFAGRLVAHFFDKQGVELGAAPLGPVNPLKLVRMNQVIQVPALAVRVSIHLQDNQGEDRGPLGEAGIEQIERAGHGS